MKIEGKILFKDSYIQEKFESRVRMIGIKTHRLNDSYLKITFESSEYLNAHTLFELQKILKELEKDIVSASVEVSTSLWSFKK